MLDNVLEWGVTRSQQVFNESMWPCILAGEDVVYVNGPTWPCILTGKDVVYGHGPSEALDWWSEGTLPCSVRCGLWTQDEESIYIPLLFCEEFAQEKLRLSGYKKVLK